VDVTREAAEHDRIAALQRRLEQLDRIIESLGAALQRSTEELERLRVELGERDAIIETLRRRSGDADGDTGIGSVHSLVRAAGRARH
jgi:prefoldin subunit 5